MHRYSRVSRKYKNEVCRFNFWRFFTKFTIVAEPLPADKPKDEKKFDFTEKERCT